MKNNARNLSLGIAALLASGYSANAASTYSSTSTAASAFWSFQTLANPNSSTNPIYTISETHGFAATPVLTADPGTNGATIGSTGAADGTSFTYNTNLYDGGGAGSGSGRSFLWAVNGNASIGGASFTLGLNTTALSGLAIQFNIRAATNNTGLGRPPSAFSAIEYSLNSGAWVSTGVTSPTWVNGGGSPFSEESIDLSSVTALNNQSDVRIRFTFNAGTASTGVHIENIRFDNLLITAVPEPSAVLLSFITLAGFCLRRRK